MSSNDNLPVIIVSAVDNAAAFAIIRELISDDVEPPPTNGVCSHEGGAAAESADEGEGAVWRLENKYYSARVRLLPHADRARCAPAGDVQAHLVYLTEDECGDESALRERCAAAAGWLARGGVRLAGARCGPAPRALAAAAAAARYELVPLLAEPEPDDEAFPELRGVARLREALHAHVWPGLERRDAAPDPLDLAGSSSSSSSGSWGPWRGAGALALLPAAGAARAAARAGADDAARRLRAEQLLAAFCRALERDPEGGGGGEQ